MKIEHHFVGVSALVLAACSSSTSKDNGGASGDAGNKTLASGDGGSVQTVKIDRAHLANTGTTGSLDYSDPALWVCRPGNDPNECHDDIDATEFLPDGTTKIVPHVPASDPKFDRFYVYPTVDLTDKGNMTDLSEKNIPLVLDPLLSQAARFTRICEVYAPLYRQVSLSAQTGMGDAGIAVAGDPALALGDVTDAFQYYLDHYNHGRNFVLMGHSQGSFVLTSVIASKVDGDAALRAKMISALLIGGGVSTITGQPTGGSFKNIPTCTTEGQTGCVLGYNSFAREAPPPSNSAFGKAVAGDQIICTNPGPLAGNSGSYAGSYLPLHVNDAAFNADGTFPTGVTTPFALYPNMFSGQCQFQNGYSYLEISVTQPPGDKRAVPPYRSKVIESIGFGLHVADYNLSLEDLISAVEKQAAAMK